MSLTRSKDPQYPHFGDYKLFRMYMKKETYWAHLYVEATLLIERMQVEGPQLPSTFGEFYKLSLKSHILQVTISTRSHYIKDMCDVCMMIVNIYVLSMEFYSQAFVHLMDAVKSSDTSEKMPELVFSAKRLIYRFVSLSYC